MVLDYRRYFPMESLVLWYFGFGLVGLVDLARIYKGLLRARMLL